MGDRDFEKNWLQTRNYYLHEAVWSLIFARMSTAELIFEQAKALPEAMQTEALHYVNYLLSQKHAQAGDWARLFTEHLSARYVPDSGYEAD